jgi:hypothetical protein
MSFDNQQRDCKRNRLDGAIALLGEGSDALIPAKCRATVHPECSRLRFMPIASILLARGID